MAARGYGNLYIRWKLMGEGIPEDMADTALEALEHERTEAERIEMIRNKAEKSKAGLAKFLYQRGFTPDAIYQATHGEES